MKCKVIRIVRVDRKDPLPPCFDIWAIGVRNDEDLNVTGEDYYYSCSEDNLPPIFKKRLYPPTLRQADEIQKKCKTDRLGNMVGEPIFIRLMSYEWKVPFPYYRLNPKSVTGVDETVEETIESEEETYLGTCIRYKVNYIPIVFSTYKVILFETPDGKCAENGGNAEGVCKRCFCQAVTSGTILLQKDAKHVKEVVKDEEEWIYDDKENYAWKDYYNWGYYNDGLDMDQQDERFWNF